MITNFKIFENQEHILNNILDKIQQSGKDSLDSQELNFLDDYPNGKIESNDNKPVSEKTLKKFTSENFEFILTNIETDELSRTMFIHGTMYFPADIIKGYIAISLETYSVVPYFFDQLGRSSYEITEGIEYEFDDFINEIYETLEK